MKSYTDITQSKKLAEFLFIESADGFYEAQHNPLTDKWEYIFFTDNKWASEEVVIPAWSLAALLDILPNGTETHKQVNESISCYFVEVYNNKKYFSTERYDNLLDACYDMILKLHEEKLL